MRVDLLVVGAGLSGAVVAERAARVLGWRVLVVERRAHVAGNAHDFLDSHGVRVHAYGPHVLHTDSELVWRYLSRFTGWRAYETRVSVAVGDRLAPLPVNLESLGRIFPPGRARRLREALLRAFGEGARVPILRPPGNPDPRVRWLADFLYENVFLGFNLKHWGLRPEEFAPAVTARVPIRIDTDDRYFGDRFQGLPRDWYTAMVGRMLDHPGIEVLLRTDFHYLPRIRAQRILYTGAVDRFFGHRHGPLPYRSVRFDLRHEPAGRIEPTGSITYPGAEPFTRSCEYKILTGQPVRGTTRSFEVPEEFVPGRGELAVPGADGGQPRHSPQVRAGRRLAGPGPLLRSARALPVPRHGPGGRAGAPGLRAAPEGLGFPAGQRLRRRHTGGTPGKRRSVPNIRPQPVSTGRRGRRGRRGVPRSTQRGRKPIPPGRPRRSRSPGGASPDPSRGVSTGSPAARYSMGLLGRFLRKLSVTR